MESTPNQPDERTQAELDVRKLGQRLGLLLATARLPQEQKDAWLGLVPSMTPAQLDQLAAALERYVPDAQEEAFSQLTVRLGAAEGSYANRVSAATAEADQALGEIAKELPSS